MNKHKWGIKGCLRKVKYYNEHENFYYWKSWTIQMFKEGDWAKIGSLDTINQLLSLCKRMLYEVQGYIKEEQLDEKWWLDMANLNTFLSELHKIVKDLDDSQIENSLKDLAKIERRALDLKLHILESSFYVKYLLHKEMNMLRLRGELEEGNQIDNQVDNSYKENIEEVKSSNKKGLQKKDKPSPNSELN